MVVQWKVPIGARVFDVVAGRDTDQVYVATDDCVIVMAGRDVVARSTRWPRYQAPHVFSADDAFVYILGHNEFGRMRFSGCGTRGFVTDSGVFDRRGARHHHQFGDHRSSIGWPSGSGGAPR